MGLGYIEKKILSGKYDEINYENKINLHFSKYFNIIIYYKLY